MDLLDFIRDERPWGQFWRLLGQLSGDSRYRAAQLDDPEVAALLAEGEDTPKWRPAASDFTLMHELAAQQRDLLADLVVITGRGLPSNGRRQFPDQFPRPETETDRARKRFEQTREQRYDESLLEFAEAAKARWRAQQAAEAQGSADAST